MSFYAKILSLSIKNKFSNRKYFYTKPMNLKNIFLNLKSKNKLAYAKQA